MRRLIYFSNITSITGFQPVSLGFPGKIIILTIVLTILILLIRSVVIILSSILAKKTITDREKNSPFECGFDPKGRARLPFSLRFFLIAVIFLIFDVEITLLLPLASIINITNITTWMFTGIFFLLILLLGLYHEWDQGALEWADWNYSQLTIPGLHSGGALN